MVTWRAWDSSWLSAGTKAFQWFNTRKGCTNTYHMNNNINTPEVSQLMPTLKLNGVSSSLCKNLSSLPSRRVQSQHQDLLVLQDLGGPVQLLYPQRSSSFCSTTITDLVHGKSKSQLSLYFHRAYKIALPLGRLTSRLVCVNQCPPACSFTVCEGQPIPAS